MFTQSVFKKTPSPARTTSADITEQDAAWSPDDHDSLTENSHELADADILSSKVHYPQGKPATISDKNRLITTWKGHERAIGLLQYGQDNNTAEDLAWAADPVPDVFETRLEADLSGFILHELSPIKSATPQSSKSSDQVPEPTSETKRAVQEVMDAIRAANPPKPAVETEEARIHALKAQKAARSKRIVERWLVNVSISNLLDPFMAAKPPSSYYFIVDDCPCELSRPDPVYLSPGRSNASDEVAVGSSVRRFVLVPNKDVAPYMDIKRQLDVGKEKRGGSSRPLVAVPQQAY